MDSVDPSLTMYVEKNFFEKFFEKPIKDIHISTAAKYLSR